MAKQKSIIKLAGTIGGITFLKTQDGYLAKEKTSINGKRIASDPAFQRTRENNTEFGAAGKAVKMFRNAFRLQLQQAQDGRIISRMLKEMMKVIKTDTVSNRGQRQVANGELAFLETFECNVNATLRSTLFTTYASVVDRAAGTVQVSVAGFTPATEIAAPQGTTHYRVISAASAINFAAETFTTNGADWGILPWHATPEPAFTLISNLPPASTDPIVVVLGIQFFQMVNGTPYPLKNGTFNPLSIIKVDKP